MDEVMAWERSKFSFLGYLESDLHGGFVEQVIRGELQTFAVTCLNPLG